MRKCSDFSFQCSAMNDEILERRNKLFTKTNKTIYIPVATKVTRRPKDINGYTEWSP